MEQIRDLTQYLPFFFYLTANRIQNDDFRNFKDSNRQLSDSKRQVNDSNNGSSAKTLTQDETKITQNNGLNE